MRLLQHPQTYLKKRGAPDMNDLTLNLEAGVATVVTEVVITPIDRLGLLTKQVARSMAKAAVLDEQLADQTIAVNTAKQQLTEVLGNGGNGFDAASRTYKQANAKLDKLLEQREAVMSIARQDLESVREVTADVSAQLRDLEG